MNKAKPDKLPASPDFDFLDRTEQLANFPVILVGTEYWLPMVAWIKNQMVAHQTIDEYDLRRLAVTVRIGWSHCDFCVRRVLDLNLQFSPQDWSQSKATDKHVAMFVPC